MDSAWVEIILIFVLIVINGLFAMSEIAMVSARKVRLQQLAEDGEPSAQVALNMSKEPNRLLSTVQVGITLVSVFTGAFGGARLAGSIAPTLAAIPGLEPYSDGLALALVVLGITYFSLVIGELIPKRLGLNNPERVAMLMARPMAFLAWLTRPVVQLLSVSTEIGLRLLGVKLSKEPPITEEEIKILMDQGTQVGVFEEGEQDIVEGVFRLADRRVDAIMTPRTEVVWLNLDAPLETNMEIVLQSKHSLFPVAQGNLDNVLGVISTKDLLVAHLQGEEVDLKALVQRPLFIPESMPALKALEEIRRATLLIALVIDEYGGMLGMITLLDVLKAIVGEIPDSGEAFEPPAIQRPDGSWLIEGLMQVDELKELLDLDELPDEERVGYQTVGGLMMSQLGEIPSPGMSFDWEDFHFEVLDMDNRRVDKILVIPPQTAADFQEP